MTEKHTPGSWLMSVNKELQGIDVQTPSGVAAVVAGRTFEERKANAALIAAAPDLLAALLETALQSDVDGGDPCWCPWLRHPDELHKAHCIAAKAAIQKARGEK